MWFKDHFVKCNNRAAMVKTWLPAPQDGPKSWLDQLVYDRALTLVRTVIGYQCLLFTDEVSLCRVERLPAKNFWIKLRAPTNARNCTRNPSGASMLFKMICYKREIHSWTKIGRQLPPVCFLSFVDVTCLASFNLGSQGLNGQNFVSCVAMLGWQ
jgi:hypothetical protein